MNHFYDGSVNNNLKKYENISVTVFRKKEENWEKLLDPFYCGETKSFPKIESWRNTVTISVALNHPIGDDKTCTVTKIENGTHKGPTQVGNFKWEIELTSTKESYSDPSTMVEILVNDGSEVSSPEEETSDESEGEGEKASEEDKSKSE